MTTNNIYADAAGTAAAGSGGETVSLYRRYREIMDTKSAKAILFLLQFIGSLFTVFYLKKVAVFAYNSLFYRLDIPAEQTKSYAVATVFSCIGWGALLLFTRRQIVTRWVIMLCMPLYFPIFLFNYRHMCLIIPLGILIVITYLASGTGEGVKTIFGAVWLMFYVVGAFVFLAIQSVLQPAISEYTVERGASQSGSYRYSVVEVNDRADGHTYVSIEPNTYDLPDKHATWYAKGYAKKIYLERPRTEFTASWEIKARTDITRELLMINPRMEFTLNAKQMQTLGLDAEYSKTYTVGDLGSKIRRKLGIAIKSDLLGQDPAALGLELRESGEEITLDFNKMLEVGLAPSTDIRLSNLSDENLAALGVPAQCDVLSVNGKVVFRQYIAVLECTFDEDSRNLAAFLETNDLPEIVDPKDIPPVPERKRASDMTAPAETTTTPEETTSETTETAEETTAAP